MDSDFFNREALAAQALVTKNRRLGDLVEDGYRVVYESTETVDRLEGEALYWPYFLQSADITTPFINAAGMGCVKPSDWARYPKGRVRPGELLIEVKGKAEKLAIVPDDFPRNTLVTGTCFKLTTKSPDDRYWLLAYLTCSYGQLLKDRLKTNLLVSYLAKEDLYSISVPTISNAMVQAVKKVMIECFELEARAGESMVQLEEHLFEGLKLKSWPPPEPLTYVQNSVSVLSAIRLDAEYFYPAKQAAQSILLNASRHTVGDQFESIRELWQPDDDESEDEVRNYDLNDALAPFLEGEKPSTSRDLIASTKKRLREGDLVVSRLRSYLKEIAIVESGGGLPMVASTEFIVLRPKLQNSLPVEALMIYLRSALPQLIFKWSQDGSNHPRFDERELLRLPIPRAVSADADQYVKSVREIQTARKRAVTLLNAAKRAVEIAIEDNEAAALAYLESVASART